MKVIPWLSVSYCNENKPAQLSITVLKKELMYKDSQTKNKPSPRLGCRLRLGRVIKSILKRSYFELQEKLIYRQSVILHWNFIRILYFVVPHSSDQAVSGVAATFWLSLSGAETYSWSIRCSWALPFHGYNRTGRFNRRLTFGRCDSFLAQILNRTWSSLFCTHLSVAKIF